MDEAEEVRPDQDRELTEAVQELTAEDIGPARRRTLLGRLVRDQIRRQGVRVLMKPRAAARWMSDAVLEVAPHLPIRDLETLRQHYDGLDGEQLAQRLVRNASRVTAGIGAAGGG